MHSCLLFAVTALAFLCVAPVVDAKKVAGQLTLDSMVTEQYISKFSFSSGATGKIDGDFLVEAAYLAQRPAFLMRSRHVRFKSLQVAVYNQVG